MREYMRDEIRTILQGVGACGESDGISACILPPDHAGLHGFELGICQWHECPEIAEVSRTDLGGTTFILCRQHMLEGHLLGYWRND